MSDLLADRQAEIEFCPLESFGERHEIVELQHNATHSGALCSSAGDRSQSLCAGGCWPLDDLGRKYLCANGAVSVVSFPPTR